MNTIKDEKQVSSLNSIHVLVLIILLIGNTTSCTSSQASLKEIPLAEIETDAKPADYLIQFGDELEIKFFYNPELNEIVTVRPDGKISLLLVDETQAAGLKPSQLDEYLTQAYSQELQDPNLTVIVRSFSSYRVYIGGEVNRPGLLNLTGGLTALQAIFNAGGLKETAQPEHVIVIRKGMGGRPVPMRVNLKDVLYGKSAGAEFRLSPDDIVFVPKSAIAEANKFVTQYIKGLLMFNGINMGFTYELTDKINLSN
jgi:polysaccharide biosynthesis/export protein PslD